jgi:hypothetical protein
MRVLIALFFAGLLTVLASSVLLVMAPYALYERALYDGLENDFIHFGPVNPQLLTPIEREFPSEVRIGHPWEIFHFSTFDLPLPAHHREFILIPSIDEYEDFVSLGGVFYGFNQREFVRFRIDQTEPFQLVRGQGMVFDLPVFSNRVAQRSTSQLWQDVFTLDLRLPSEKTFVWSRARELWAIPYHELVYRLVIYEMRRALFPEETSSISYYRDKGFGVIEIEEEGVNDTQVIRESLEPEVTNEIIFLLANNHLHRLRLRTHLYEQTAQDYRAYLFENLRYRYSNEDASFPLYGQYRSLGVKDRADQRGMTYLFAGWSHVPERREYLREMIQQLERGRSHARHLTPLYQFSIRKYGTNFSSFKDRLVETADQRARREALQVREQEFEELVSREISSDVKEPEGEDRIHLFLRRAKDDGHNDDRQERILIEY